MTVQQPPQLSVPSNFPVNNLPQQQQTLSKCSSLFCSWCWKGGSWSSSASGKGVLLELQLQQPLQPYMTVEHLEEKTGELAAVLQHQQTKSMGGAPVATRGYWQIVSCESTHTNWSVRNYARTVCQCRILSWWMCNNAG